MRSDDGDFDCVRGVDRRSGGGGCQQAEDEIEALVEPLRESDGAGLAAGSRAVRVVE